MMNQSLQCTHDEVANEEHHWLTKYVPLDVSHPLISPLKAVAPTNISDYMMNKATMQMSVMEEKEI
jgi:hypothetical protein